MDTPWIRRVRCRTRVGVGQLHNTDVYDYTQLYYFLKLLSVLMCQCPCRVCVRASLRITEAKKLQIWRSGIITVKKKQRKYPTIEKTKNAIVDNLPGI